MNLVTTDSGATLAQYPIWAWHQATPGHVLEYLARPYEMFVL
jgi:hypothetical protein